MVFRCFLAHPPEPPGTLISRPTMRRRMPRIKELNAEIPPGRVLRREKDTRPRPAPVQEKPFRVGLCVMGRRVS